MLGCVAKQVGVVLSNAAEAHNSRQSCDGTALGLLLCWIIRMRVKFHLQVASEERRFSTLFVEMGSYRGGVLVSRLFLGLSTASTFPLAHHRGT